MPDGRAAAGSRLARVDWQLAITLILMVGLLVPVVVVPGTFFPYVVPRNVLFRVAVELATAVLVANVVIGNKRLDLRREHVLFALVGFLVAIILSAIVSPARSHSFHGDFERMGGVWAWLHLALFFLVLRALEEKYLVWLLGAAVGISVYASAHGFIEHFAEGVNGTTGGLSIVGNPGLFAGYLLIAISLALYLAGRVSRYRWIYVGAAAADLAALILTQNRSSILGLAAGVAIATVLLILFSGGGARRRIAFAFIAGMTLLVIALTALARTVDHSVVSSAVPRVIRRIALTDFAGRDASRAVQWNAALAGLRDRPVLGYGPENHHLAWSAHFDPRIYELGTEVFDRTHNAFLEVLVTTGLIGTFAFAAIWCAIGYSLYRAFRAARLAAREFSLFAGVNVAYATYLVFWFIDINAAMLWILAAAFIAARYKSAPIVRDREPRGSRSWVAPVATLHVTGLALALGLYAHAYSPLRASAALAELDSYGGDSNRAFEAVRTVSNPSALQTSHTGPVLAEFIAALKRRGKLEAAPAGSERRADIDQTFETAIAALDAELLRDPLNDRLHAFAAGVLIEASHFYDSAAHREQAIALLKRAIELSPRRREQRRMLEGLNTN